MVCLGGRRSDGGSGGSGSRGRSGSGCGSGSAAIGAYLTKKHGAPQCVSIRQPGGAIAVTTRCAEDGALSSLTISGTVLLGRSKKADVTL